MRSLRNVAKVAAVTAAVGTAAVLGTGAAGAATTSSGGLTVAQARGASGYTTEGYQSYVYRTTGAWVHSSQYNLVYTCGNGGVYKAHIASGLYPI